MNIKKFLIAIFLLFGVAVVYSLSFAQGVALFDLVNLKERGLADITPYEKIKIIDAWNFLELARPLLNAITVGIFDTGADLTHPEFNQVNVAAISIIDAAKTFFRDGHGTQVTGIIGANNLSFFGQYITPHMNGILSGVRDLNYALHIRSKEEFVDGFGSSVVIDQLARSPVGLHIINSSFGAPLCSELTFIQKRFLDCFGIDEFNIWQSITTELVNQYPDILFSFGAGNARINAGFNVPGGAVIASNVIAVGGTDFDDGRAIFSSLEESNFGSAVNISAPAINIYSPKPTGAAQLEYDPNFSGTSAAAPMVTGVAAILKALEPEYRKYTQELQMTPQKIKEILIKSADPIFPDETLGSGCFNQPAASTGCRLNSHRAVAWQFPPASSTLSISTITASSIFLSWNLSDFDFKNPDFDSYQLFRLTSSPVTQSSTLVFSTNDSSILTFADTGLSPSNQFFYKLYTFDKAGLSSESNEVSAKTASPFPSDTWHTRAFMPVGNSGFAVTKLDGKIHVFGGFGGGTRHDVYDPVTDSWSARAPLPISLERPTGEVVGGKIYIIGGKVPGGPWMAMTWEYNPLTDSWRQRRSMPTSRWALASAAVDGKIYAIGGKNTDPGGHLDVVEEYDPATDTWRSRSRMPTPRAQFTAVVATAMNGKIYIFGGTIPVDTTGDTLSNSVQIYDPASDVWSFKTSLPMAVIDMDAEAVGNNIYVFGGQRTANLATVLVYDANVNSWTIKSNMPTWRFLLGTAEVDGNIYVIGGHNFIEFLRTNEMYVP